MGKGPSVELTVSSPKAYSSAARNLRAFKGPLAASAPVYTLYGTVVMIADSEQAARDAVLAAQGQFAWLTPAMLVPSENLEGVYSIGVRSVENAVAISTLIGNQAGIQMASVDVESPKRARGGADPALGAQWHIENALTPTIDHDIQAVHDSGVTGSGVVVGVLEANGGNFTSPYDPDDLDVPGYDFSDVVHPDLFGNFSLALSQTTDPFQVGVSHETSVAGLIGATANSSFGRGVAYGSQIAALRNGSDLQNAEAWAHKFNEIDITNNSWGPANDVYPLLTIAPVAQDDNEVFFPSNIRVPVDSTVELALNQNYSIGRARKGRPNVMAAGNASAFQGFLRFSIGNATSLPQFGLLDITGSATGTVADFQIDGADTTMQRYSGLMGDRTEYWEVNSHPASLVIAAVGEDNMRAGYSTTGTAILAAAYSEGGVLDTNFGPTGYGFTSAGRAITTTNQISEGPDGDCPVALSAIPGLTCSFNGTSAAAPIATGIFALMLEANPNLSIRDIEHIIKETSNPVGFNPVGSYWTNLVGYGNIDPDDPMVSNPIFWQANSGDVLHSDELGFGVIDADAAVAMARTWTGAGRLQVLDTGVIESQVSIPDAEYTEVGAFDDMSGPKVLYVLTPGDRVEPTRELPNGSIINGTACVRENISIETVLVTVTISGAGAGDLLIMLESPNGTVSPLAIPRNDSAGVTTDFAYFSYTFKTYKHWGESSGGTWRLYMQDFRPDAATPEGELPDDGGTPMDPSDDDPGEEHITLLGVFGMQGGEFFEHSEKEMVSFRMQIRGTNTSLPPSLDCPPVLTACPGDLNGNGVVTFEDLAIFLSWYNNNDPLADINGDGQVTFDDIQFFLTIWQPGFCTGGGSFGRPGPNTSVNDPVIRPI